MVKRYAIGEIFKRLTSLGKEAQFDGSQRKFVGQLRIGASEFFGNSRKGRVDRQSGFRTNDEQIDSVGQAFADQVGPLGNQVVDINISAFIAQDRSTGEHTETLEVRPVCQIIETIYGQSRSAAQNDR